MPDDPPHDRSASDLTAAARIRTVALELFAHRGVAATSIRDVAAAAAVSPGLVQHHFRTKEGLRAAVNQHVLAVMSDALEQVRNDETLEQMGDRVTAFVRDNATAMRYIARGLTEHDHDAFALFDALVEIGLNAWLGPERKRGALRRDADLEWAAIHVATFNLATVLFEGAIECHLPDSFYSAEQLQRWNAATTALYRHGLYKNATQTRTRRA